MSHENDQMVKIIVEAREVQVEKNKEMSYRDVVILAEGNYNEDPNVRYTVTYSENKHSQTHDLVDGGKTVKAKEGMIFNVTPTDKS